MTKTEVGAYTYRADVKPIHQVLAHESVWRESGKVAIESSDEQQIDAGLCDHADLTLLCADSLRRLVRRQNLDGVGLKRHGNGGQSEFARVPHDGLKNRLMAQVQTVEVSNAQNTPTACKNARGFG